MSVARGKLVKVTYASGSYIKFELQQQPPTTKFEAHMDDPDEVHPTAPHEVTATTGSEGLLYLMDAYLSANNIPIYTQDPKWPETLAR